LAGPLLFSNDTLGLFQGSLEEGDILKVENVGAYCYSLAWEISYKKPKIVIK
jgi:diaminopimelate decarboxylase